MERKTQVPTQANMQLTKLLRELRPELRRMLRGVLRSSVCRTQHRFQRASSAASSREFPATRFQIPGCRLQIGGQATRRRLAAYSVGGESECLSGCGWELENFARGPGFEDSSGGTDRGNQGGIRDSGPVEKLHLCHPERSEGSSNSRRINIAKILRCAQNDKRRLLQQPHSHLLGPATTAELPDTWRAADTRMPFCTTEPTRHEVSQLAVRELPSRPGRGQSSGEGS
jgi:hypothetical protein